MARSAQLPLFFNHLLYNILAGPIVVRVSHPLLVIRSVASLLLSGFKTTPRAIPPVSFLTFPPLLYTSLDGVIRTHIT